MFSRKQTLRTVLPLLCALLISIRGVESFRVGPSVTKNDTPSTARFPSSSLVSTTPESIPSSSSFFASELNAKKKKTVVEEEPEREKNNPLGLLIVYMTPWRNPNSIFVYMFGIVYALGKYSEAQAIARDSGVL